MSNYIYNAHIDESTNRIDFIEQILNDDGLVGIERAEGVTEITDAVISAGFPDDTTFMETWTEQDRYMIDGVIANG
jgi:hypothetical protein